MVVYTNPVGTKEDAMGRVVVTVTKELDNDFWATPEQFAEMTDQDVVDLVKEDVIAFLDGACWTVDREPQNV